MLSGWGVRPYDWQWGASVQQEILPRTSLEVGYARRWFNNFFVNDNINISPSDFQSTTITAPTNAKLPDGGGYPATYQFLRPGANTAIQNRYTFASDYGDWTNYWHGVDVTVNSRLRNGLTLQIGSSTGRAVTDNCEVAALVPEVFNPALTNPSPFTTSVYQQTDSCHKVESWQTQVRGFASYVIPKIDVLLSTIMRFQPNATFGVGATPEGNSTGLSANYVCRPVSRSTCCCLAANMPTGSIRSIFGSASSSALAAREQTSRSISSTCSMRTRGRRSSRTMETGRSTCDRLRSSTRGPSGST